VGSDLGGWLVPVILFVVGLILTLYPEGQAVVSADHVHEPAHVAPPAPRPALEHPAPAPEQEPVVEPEIIPQPAVQAAAAMVDEGAPAIAPIRPDDLTRIEGIGPKMSAALIAAGIDTYAKLADTREDDLRNAIKSQGMRFAPSLTTWAEQAGYAAKGDWAGLATMQQNLKAGR